MNKFNRKTQLKNAILGFLLLTILPTAASAGDLDFTYLEAGLSQVHLTGDDGSGYTVTGSLGLPLGFFLDGSRASVDFKSNSEQQRTTARAGWYVGVLDHLDLVFRVGRTHVDASGTNISATGYDDNIGLRVWLPAGCEGEAEVGKASASFTYFPGSGYGIFGPEVYPAKDSERYESVALRNHVTDNLLLGLSYRTATSHDAFNGDTTFHTWLLTARFTF